MICQKCGLHQPVIADACQLQNKAQQMLVADGTVEGKPVSVMRDTGCSTVVVRRSLVPDGKLTGQIEDFILIDGTVPCSSRKDLCQNPLLHRDSSGRMYGRPNMWFDYWKHFGCHTPTVQTRQGISPAN